MAEYRYKNGRWKLDIVVPRGRVTLQQDVLPTVAYADDEWEAHQQFIRAECP
jgi:hypothetical protein